MWPDLPFPETPPSDFSLLTLSSLVGFSAIQPPAAMLFHRPLLSYDDRRKIKIRPSFGVFFNP